MRKKNIFKCNSQNLHYSITNVQKMSTNVCVYLYPEIQFCADSGRLCLFQAPRLALCAGRCGPDDQHIVVGRRERCARREGAWHAPSRALRRTMLDRRRGGKNKGRKEEVQERVRRKISKDELKEAEKG